MHQNRCTLGVCQCRYTPPCLAAWRWTSQSSPPPVQRKTEAWGLWRTGLQERRALWLALRNRCCGSPGGGGHWEVMGQGQGRPCPEVALECWTGERWGRCPRSTLRRSKWLGTRSPAAARSQSDPSPSHPPGSQTLRPDLEDTEARIKTLLSPTTWHEPRLHDLFWTEAPWLTS